MAEQDAVLVNLVRVCMKVIFSGDDFGSSTAVNDAILKAHREGVLTSASLMVTGTAVEDAIARARATPTLAVGLHLVVVHGRSCLHPARIPHLVDAHGYFSANPVQAGLRYFFDKTVQQELEQEVKAQFGFFASTGLPLAHVDGHLHMHMHPTVFRLLLPWAERDGASGIRLPRDDLRLSLRYNRQHWRTKTTWAAIFALLSRWAASQLAGHRLKVTDRVCGLLNTGAMEEEYVVRMLRELNVATCEFYFHPTTSRTGERLGANSGDLASLLSPRVKRVIHERGIELTTYPGL